ncbi:MAG TPA: hydrogenase maturation nickel metallochaperone HypA [Gallionellaceae bacterium]|nr:hydrogenase maturation nickel metallochaperone HypA [Gallionellaceae bacterium]
MSLAESVLQIIEDTARVQPFSRVRSVVLEVGALSAVEPEAMTFCFDAVTRGSLAEGARLEIVEIPGTGWCMHCGKNVTLNERYGLCPDCGDARVEITGGTEMRVRDMEVE